MPQNPYNLARFVQAVEQERHPVMLTAFEMKIISNALRGVREYVQMQVDQFGEDEDYSIEGEDTPEFDESGEKLPTLADRVKFLKCHAQHLEFMAGKMAGFAHDIKEKAEAKYDIEV